MAAAARISLHIHKLVSKKGHWFLKKAKILPKLFESLVNIVTSFVWLRLYWLRLRRRKPLIIVTTVHDSPNEVALRYEITHTWNVTFLFNYKNFGVMSSLKKPHIKNGGMKRK